jgi:hypothetical protein
MQSQIVRKTRVRPADSKALETVNICTSQSYLDWAQQRRWLRCGRHKAEQLAGILW